MLLLGIILIVIGWRVSERSEKAAKRIFAAGAVLIAINVLLTLQMILGLLLASRGL